jgi:hypothetical protein
MSVIKSSGALLRAAMLALVVSFAFAEPTSGPVTISELRPYIGGNGVYVYLSGTGPCGSGVTGAKAIYTIDLSSSAGKAAYAALLTAVATGKQAVLEVIANACGAIAHVRGEDRNPRSAWGAFRMHHSRGHSGTVPA